MGFIAAAICVVCLIKPFKGSEISLGMAQHSQRLTTQEAIDAARRNSKAGSSFTVLRAIVANADTRRIGDQALEYARARQIELYEHGILADLLSSGGFLLAESEPRTNNLIGLHLVSLAPEGVPKDVFFGCHGALKLADARDLVNDTAEFTEKLYSTPPSEAASLENRFFGGSFPECGESQECTLFAVPRSLLKLGAGQNENREAVALYGGLGIWQFRYAVSMPAFAASPLVAAQTASKKWDALKAEFLRNSHMAPDYDFDLENIQSKEQLRERIDVLRRLDKFTEEALRNEANPALVKGNLSVALIPLGVDADTQGGQAIYGSGTASLFGVYWRRLPTGGFAVHLIAEAG
jgi:hypothetical protein